MTSEAALNLDYTLEEPCGRSPCLALAFESFDLTSISNMCQNTPSRVKLEQIWIKAVLNLNCILEKPCGRSLCLALELESPDLISLTSIRRNFYASSWTLNAVDYITRPSYYGRNKSLVERVWLQTLKLVYRRLDKTTKNDSNRIARSKRCPQKTRSATLF